MRRKDSTAGFSTSLRSGRNDDAEGYSSGQIDVKPLLAHLPTPTGDTITLVDGLSSSSSQIPPPTLRRRSRTGPRHTYVDECAPAAAYRPRLYLLGTPGYRKDHYRPHPRECAQLP